MVWDALPLAGIDSVKTAHPAMDRQVTLYYMDNFGGVAFQPTEFVDITGTLGKKLEALGKHASQLRIFRQLLEVDLADVVATTAKFRGYQAGSAYAEGFVKVEAWYRGLTRRVLPSAGDPGRFVYRSREPRSERE